jgi:parvulin-like peptidyl-prolyl isomerase
MVSSRGTRRVALLVLTAGLGLTGCMTQGPSIGLLAAAPASLGRPDTAEAPVARGQKPASPEPSGPNPLNLGPGDPGSKDARGARIRAVVNGEAILEEEVIASAYQVLAASPSEAEKAQVLNAKLNEIIDREVILQDAVARLNKGGGERFLHELKKAATKEFEKQWLHRMMRANHYTDEAKFKKFVRANGMPYELIKRQWERNFMAMEYMRSLMEPKMNRIGHLQVAEYYDKHPNEFRVEDELDWQDMFISVAKHQTREAAQAFAEVLIKRIRQGEDFAALGKQYDDGESSLRKNCEGLGHKQGDIRPQELEPTLFSMKQNEVALVPMSTGYHIIALTKRQHAGKKPFDKDVQKQIKEKLRGKVFQEEMKRAVNELKRKAIIEVATEIK